MSWIGDKAEAAANVLKELLMQTPAARIARGDLPNVLADLSRTAEEDRKRSLGRVRDAYVGREVNFTPEELESTSAFWNPAGMLGKIVYHGSPHKFDKFDASKIGTGEGAQAYGHGVYLADAEDVAKGYATTLANRDSSGYLTAHKNAQDLVARFKGDAEWASEVVSDQLRNLNKSDPNFQRLTDTLAAIQSKAYTKPLENPGALYKADLPDEWIPKMLDWDKPLSQQSDAVKVALRKSPIAPDESVWQHYTGQQLLEGEMQASGPYGKAGWATPEARALASKKLYESGIPGIRYLDGGSRPNSGRITMLEQTIANLKNKGASKAAIANTQHELDAELARASYNYVVFPGLEDKVKILERNGQPVNALAEILK